LTRYLIHPRRVVGRIIDPPHNRRKNGPNNTILQNMIYAPISGIPAGARIQRLFFQTLIGVTVFISNAYAQTAADSGAMGQLSTFLPLILMFVVMYFLMIRPQQKRAKEQKAMMDALAKGDEVVTAGGILGKVSKVTDAYVTVEVAVGTEIVVQKASVTTLLPKGTLKGL
jgi:preprotein translocase subunit YajC